MSSDNTIQNKSLDDEFFAKRVLVQYRDFIEIQTLKADKDKFFKILKAVEDDIKSKVTNVNKNIIFLCDTDVSRYAFLVCLLKLPRSVSNRYMNSVTLCDIWWGDNNSRTNLRVDDEDAFTSTQDIKEDVCCIYIDPTMPSNTNNGKILASTIATRENRYNRKYEHLINWVFYRGDEASMQSNANTSDTYFYFQDGNPETHQIVKLRSFKSYVSTSGTNINVSNLSDLY